MNIKEYLKQLSIVIFSTAGFKF